MTSITHHYAIRININDNLPYIIQNLQNLNNYTELLISPVEISQKNGKPHIHIYIKLIIPIQTNSIRKHLKTNNVVQTGNENYSLKQVTTTKYNKTIEEAIAVYKSYCLKTKEQPLYLSSPDIIQNIPEWKPKKVFKAKKTYIFKELVAERYKPIQTNLNNTKAIRLHILEFLLELYKELDKPFTKSTISMYGNYLLNKFYLIHPEMLYECIFRYSSNDLF